MSVSKKNTSMVVVLIVAIAIVLRAPITAVGSILYCIVEDLNLSGTLAGSISTIPLVVMSLFSPFVSYVSEKKGIGKSLFLAMVLMIAGILMRSFAGVSGLLLGTIIIAVGITFGNVLIPAMIKMFFPDKVGRMTGVFTMTMSMCSGIGAGLSVPLAIDLGLGWRWMFCLWAVLAGVCLFVIALYIKANPEKDLDAPQPKVEVQATKAHKTPLYKNSVAWALSFMFASQSAVFFTLTAWLPTIIADRGFSAETAGVVAMVFQIAGIPANLGVPLIAEKMKNLGGLAAGSAAVGLLGVIAIYFANSLPMFLIGAILVQLGTGGVFSLNLTLYGMKTDNAVDAARVSGFAQSTGYMLAAIGPIAAGTLYDMTASWSLPLIFCIVIMVIAVVSSYVSGAGSKIH